MSTKDRIFNAALAEFKDKGGRGVSTRAVAKRAGVNNALLHYHFASMDELLNLCRVKLFEKFFPDFTTALEKETSSLKKLVAKTVQIFYSHALRNKELIQILVLDKGKLPSMNFDFEILKADAKNYVHYFNKVVEKKAEKGKIKEVDINHLWRLIISLTYSPVVFEEDALVMMDLGRIDKMTYEQEVVDVIWAYLKQK